MARVTIEDCLARVENRFILIHMAAKRVRELKDGDAPLVKSSNREVVTALREIAAGKLVMVPKPSEKGKPAEMKDDMEARLAPAPISEETRTLAAGSLEANSGADQGAAGHDEAIVLGKVIVETAEETSY